MLVMVLGIAYAASSRFLSEGLSGGARWGFVGWRDDYGEEPAAAFEEGVGQAAAAELREMGLSMRMFPPQYFGFS